MTGVTSTVHPATVAITEVPWHKRGAFPTVNLGPLTTTFEPPDNCDALGLVSKDYRKYTTFTIELYSFLYGKGCGTADATFDMTSSCVPPRYASAYNDGVGGRNDLILPVYSPGLACPSGYLPACTFYGNETKAVGNYLNASAIATVGGTYMAMMDAQETAIGCCPSAYLCDELYSCGSKPTDGATLVAAGRSCLTGIFKAESTVVLLAEAPMVMLVQSGATRTDLTASTSATTSEASGSPSSMPEFKGDNGLSAGAKAGIAIGAVLAVLFIALAAFLLFRRRRKRQSDETTDARKPELDSNRGMSDWMRGNEAAPGDRSTAGPTSPCELDATTDPRHSRGVSTVMLETEAWSDGKRLSELNGFSSVVTPSLHESIIELPADMGASGRQKQAMSGPPGNTGR